MEEESSKRRRVDGSAMPALPAERRRIPQKIPPQLVEKERAARIAARIAAVPKGAPKAAAAESS